MKLRLGRQCWWNVLAMEIWGLSPLPSGLDRSARRVLKLGTVIAGTALIPGVALADLRVPYPPQRELKFYNLHTGESLNALYCDKGCYVDGALKEINYILRDFRAKRDQTDRPPAAGSPVHAEPPAVHGGALRYHLRLPFAGNQCDAGGAQRRRGPPQHAY